MEQGGASVSSVDQEAVSEVVARDAVAAGDQWNLGKLFASPEAFEEGLTDFENRIAEAAAWKDGLAGVDEVVAALTYSQEMGLLDERLGYYSFLRYSEDAGDSANQDRMGRYTALAARFQAAFSYFEPALQGLDEAVIDAVRADERVADFRIYLDRLFRFRPHMLGADEERILAMQAESAQTPYKAFQAASDVDATFGSVTTAEGERTLTHGTYGSFMESDQRDERKQAYTQMLRYYGEHKNMFTALYNGNVQQNVFRARVRNFGSARESSLFNDNVSTSERRPRRRRSRSRSRSRSPPEAHHSNSSQSRRGGQLSDRCGSLAAVIQDRMISV